MDSSAITRAAQPAGMPSVYAASSAPAVAGAKAAGQSGKPASQAPTVLPAAASELQINVQWHDDINRYVFRVVDQGGKVVAQLPPEGLLKMAAELAKRAANEEG